MMLLTYFLVPVCVLWLAHRFRPNIRAGGLLVLCLISIAVGQLVLYLTFSSDIPAFTFGSAEITETNAEELAIRENTAGWLLRYMSERYGWVGSAIWYWISWALFRAVTKKHNNALHATREDARA